MQLPMQQIVDAFKQRFEISSCLDFYNIDTKIVSKTIDELNSFINDGEEIDDLIEYIQNNNVFEKYINELIAPLVPSELVGENVNRQFFSSIGMYEQIAKQKQEVQGTIVIAPVMVSASLIQNAYLFVNDIYTIDDVYRMLEVEKLEINDIYDHIINILCVPLLEVLNYRLSHPNEGIPHYIVSTFGLIKADSNLNYADDIINRIEDSIKQMIEEFSDSKDVLN